MVEYILDVQEWCNQYIVVTGNACYFTIPQAIGIIVCNIPNWLVVWNIFFSIIYGNNTPNWLYTVVCFRGVETWNHQPGEIPLGQAQPTSSQRCIKQVPVSITRHISLNFASFCYPVLGLSTSATIFFWFVFVSRIRALLRILVSKK